MNRRDPRIRQTIDRFASTLESANIQTQTSLFDFSSAYVKPCLASLSTCLDSACYPCVGARRDRLRSRQRQARQGRPEHVFDFYGEWDDESADEGAGLLGTWGTDELDRLLAGSGAKDGAGAEQQQPGRPRGMGYGSVGRARRRSVVLGKGAEADPTVVPASSRFGFLERLPWMGGRGRRYRPSAADLQDNPGRVGREDVREGEALLEEGDRPEAWRGHRRKRSGTDGSRSTENSLSSRGDLFPSDDEDDAVVLGDEFAMVLERRNTVALDDSGPRKGRRREKRPARMSTSPRSRSPDCTAAPGVDARNAQRTVSGDTLVTRHDDEDPEDGLPTMKDLRIEEQQAMRDEAAEVERKRNEAQEVAVAKGLAGPRDEEPDSPSEEEDTTQFSGFVQPRSLSASPEPPAYNLGPTPREGGGD